MSNTFASSCNTECTPVQTHTYQNNNGVLRITDTQGIITAAGGTALFTLPVYSIILGGFKNLVNAGAVLNNSKPSTLSSWISLLTSTTGVPHASSEISFIDDSGALGSQNYNYFEYDLINQGIATPDLVVSLMKTMQFFNSFGFLPCEHFTKNAAYTVNSFNQVRNITVQNTAMANEYYFSVIWVDYSWLFR